MYNLLGKGISDPEEVISALGLISLIALFVVDLEETNFLMSSSIFPVVFIFSRISLPILS